MKSTVTCLTCGRVVNAYDPYFSIQLPVLKTQHNLTTCFERNSKEEILSGNDQWYCNICREHRDISKKLEIYSLPKIMIIQLKRFSQRRGGRYVITQKNETFVQYPMKDLDMRPYVKTLADYPEPVNYDLIGVTNHFGS